MKTYKLHKDINLKSECTFWKLGPFGISSLNKHLDIGQIMKYIFNFELNWFVDLLQQRKIPNWDKVHLNLIKTSLTCTLWPESASRAGMNHEKNKPGLHIAFLLSLSTSFTFMLCLLCRLSWHKWNGSKRKWLIATDRLALNYRKHSNNKQSSWRTCNTAYILQCVYEVVC